MNTLNILAPVLPEHTPPEQQEAMNLSTLKKIDQVVEYNLHSLVGPRRSGGVGEYRLGSQEGQYDVSLRKTKKKTN